MSLAYSGEKTMLQDFAQFTLAIDGPMWIITGIFLVVFGTLLLLKARKERKFMAKRQFYLGVALFFFFYGFSKFMHFIADMIVGVGDIVNYPIWWLAGTLPSYVAFTFLIFVIERNIVKTKYVFTIILIAIDVLVLVLPFDIARFITYVGSPLVGVFLVGIYIYLAQTVPGIRRTSQKRLIGLILFFAGLGLQIMAIHTLISTNFGFMIRPFANILLILGSLIYAKEHLAEKPEEQK